MPRSTPQNAGMSTFIHDGKDNYEGRATPTAKFAGAPGLGDHAENPVHETVRRGCLAPAR
jgi:hypothetical protein